MNNLFNNKLYSQYYPIKTEEEKNEFLDSNYAEIYKMVRDISSITKNELHLEREKYVSKLKPTVSFLGLPKYRNVAHNKYIVYKMRADRHIKSLEDKIPRWESLACKIMYSEYENITVDELNYILRLMNTYKHKTWMLLLLLVFLITVCVFILL